MPAEKNHTHTLMHTYAHTHTVHIPFTCRLYTITHRVCSFPTNLQFEPHVGWSGKHFLAQLSSHLTRKSVCVFFLHARMSDCLVCYARLRWTLIFMAGRLLFDSFRVKTRSAVRARPLKWWPWDLVFLWKRSEVHCISLFNFRRIEIVSIAGHI